MNDHVPEDGPKFAFMLEYFKSLREEILQAQNSRFQFGMWKFGAVSFLLGIFFNKYDTRADSAVIFYLLRFLPLLSLLFDLMYIGEVQRGIAQIGEFIAAVIENQWFQKLPPHHVDVALWENHLRSASTRKLERVSPTQVMLLFTLILLIFGCALTGDYQRLSPWTFYWLGLILFFAWTARPAFVPQN